MEILWTNHKYTPYTLYEPPNYIPWQKDRGPAEGEVPEGRGSTPAGSRHLKSSEGRGQARGRHITPNKKRGTGQRSGCTLLPTTSSLSQRFLKKTKTLKTSSVLRAIARVTRQLPQKRRIATDYPEFGDTPVRKIFRSETETVMPASSVMRAARRITGRRRKTMSYSRKRKGYSTVPRSRGIYSVGEMKYFDTERTSTAVPASVDWTGTEFPPNVGTPTTLAVPVQGTAINQRIGREITVYKVKVRGLLTVATQAAQGTADAPSLVRVALVQDTQTNAAQAQGEDIFAAPTTGTAFHAVSSFQSLANTGRFRVLKDKWIKLQNPNLTGSPTAADCVQNGLVARFAFNMRFRGGIKVRFNAANGGTIADIVDNSWCVYATASNAALVPSVVYQARVSFKE